MEPVRDGAKIGRVARWRQLDLELVGGRERGRAELDAIERQHGDTLALALDVAREASLAHADQLDQRLIAREPHHDVTPGPGGPAVGRRAGRDLGLVLGSVVHSFMRPAQPFHRHHFGSARIVRAPPTRVSSVKQGTARRVEIVVGDPPLAAAHETVLAQRSERPELLEGRGVRYDVLGLDLRVAGEGRALGSHRRGHAVLPVGAGWITPEM